MVAAVIATSSRHKAGRNRVLLAAEAPHRQRRRGRGGWKERLRATAFLRGLGCNEITLALAVVERLAHGFERNVELGRCGFRR